MSNALKNHAAESTDETDPTVSEIVDDVARILPGTFSPEMQDSAIKILDLVLKETVRRPLLAIGIAAVAGYVFASFTK